MTYWSFWVGEGTGRGPKATETLTVDISEDMSMNAAHIQDPCLFTTVGEPWATSSPSRLDRPLAGWVDRRCMETKMGSGNDRRPLRDYIPRNPIRLHSSISVRGEMVRKGGADSDWFCVCVCTHKSYVTPDFTSHTGLCWDGWQLKSMLAPFHLLLNRALISRHDSCINHPWKFL